VRGRANLGWCAACERRTLFVEEGPWLRDDYRCVRCGSIPRYRALLLVLEEVVPGWRGCDLFEGSPYGPASARLRRQCPGYVGSHYFVGADAGSTVGGVRCENLEALTFPNGSFDVVVTQDVFEHVLRPELAFAEIARVLRPGGRHVFTVPYYADRSTSLVRVVVRPDGGLEHLEPPEYHGNPIDGSGSLVVREWGRDLHEFVRRHASMSTVTYVFRDRRRGLDGEFLEVFVSSKP
jgi:SAM-dependent methyltransferase